MLFPSISLIRQTLEVWRAEGLTENRKLLVVCSDKHSASSDDVVVTEAELGCQITTCVEQAREFFRVATGCLVFSTYHSSGIIEQARPANYTFDIAVFDEAHRTTQDRDSQFSIALNDERIPCRRRLFMTATPRFGALSGDSEDDTLAMNNERLYGRICHQLSHQDAVAQGLICETKTIIGATSHAELKQFITQASKGNPSAILNIGQAIAIKRAMQAFGIKKVVTFHRTVAEAKHFSSQANVRRELGVPCFFIHGGMSGEERQHILEEFEQCESAVISNARCLTEGIDVPSIDMVAFMSPKRSVVDVVQAVGRAIRTADNKTAGHVLIPLVATQEDGLIDKSQFNEVFHILTSLIEEASVIAYKTGERFSNYEWRRTVVEQLGDYAILADGYDPQALREQIRVYCEDRSTHTFDHWYPVLRQQFETYGKPLAGDARTPEQKEWERYIRAVHREGRLSAEKTKLLTDINFKWSSSQASRWDEQYEALKRALSTKRDARTNRFLAEQRALFKDGKLSPERAEKLRLLGLDLKPSAKKSKEALQGSSANRSDNQLERIRELKEIITRYPTNVPLQCDPSSASQFFAIQSHYEKLLARNGGERVVPLNFLAKLTGKTPIEVEAEITNGQIPPPNLAIDESGAKGWSLMHVCGIEKQMGPMMAAHDPTRAWYAMLLKTELMKQVGGN